MTDKTTVKRFSPALIQLGVDKLTTAADAAKAQKLFHDALKRKKVDAANIKNYRPDLLQIAFATMDKNHPKQNGMTMQQWLATEDVKTRQGSFKSPFPKRDRKGKPLKSFYTKDAILGLSRAYVMRLKKDYLKDINPATERANNAESNHYKNAVSAVYKPLEQIRKLAFPTEPQLDLIKLYNQVIELAIATDKDAAELHTKKKQKAESGNKK